MVDVVVLGAVRHRSLQLYGGVVDAKVRVDNVEHPGADLFEISLVRGVHEYVGAERFVARRDGPDVDVVDEGYALDSLSMAEMTTPTDPSRSARTCWKAPSTFILYWDEL